VEERSFLRDACTALTVKFGGEAIIGICPQTFREGSIMNDL
jgi:hypothetical protein